MPSNLPEPAKRVVGRAVKIAIDSGSSTVEPWHLLLAIAGNGETLISRAFERNGLVLAAQIPEPSPDPACEAPGLSQRALAVIDAARQVAVRRGEVHVTVNHIALALMRSQDRCLLDTFQTKGADPAAIMRELLRVLDGFTIRTELFCDTADEALWSDEGRRIVHAAPYEATVFGHNYIGTEHLVLSLLRDKANAAAQFLQTFYNIPISIFGVPSAVKAVIGSGARVTGNRVAPTPNANRAIADAPLLASRMGRSFAGSEHILLAVIANRDCTGARALAKRVNVEWLEKDVLTVFGGKWRDG